MMKQFFRNSTAILFRRQTTIISAATVMMVLVLASRILGLVRNRFLAHFFPIETLDAYRAAFVIPDFVANVLITGALSVAFIPVFTSYLQNRKENDGWKIASSVLNISLGFYLVFTLILVVFAQPLIGKFVAPEFSPEKLALTTNLARIVLFSELLLIIGSFFTSVLQSFHRFIIPALAPVLYNIGIIIGILWLRPFFGLTGVAMGVVIGASLHAFIQFFLTKKFGFSYKFRFDIKDPGVAKIIKLSLPRAAGIGLAQAEAWVSVFLANLLGPGSIAVLGFAGDIQNLPIGLFGITFATASLPMLSAEWNAGKKEYFKTTFLATMHQVFYLTIPLSILFMVLRVPIVRLILGTGYFDWPSTVATAVTMSYFAVGIFAQSAFFLLIRAFYALQDAATPLKVAALSLVFHVAISSFFVFGFAEKFSIPVSFLGLAASLTAIFGFVILLFLLDKKVGGFDKNKLFLPLVKIVVAAAFMGVILYVPLHIRVGTNYVIDYIIDTTRVANLLILTGIAFAGGLAVYIWITWLLKSEELQTFTKLLPDVKRIQKLLDIQEKIDPGTPSS